jgi:TetR/AcrR family transcriptional regulator, transcriptional repressor for nem operon
MGRPRSFDEARAVEAAAALFARLSYDGTSVDDLVTETGVHRGSLYKTFGSKRGLYLAALRHHVDTDVTRFATALAGAAHLRADAPDLRFLILATAERASADEDVAAEVNRALTLLDEAVRPLLPSDLAPTFAALLLGLLLRRGADSTTTLEAAATLLSRLT